MTALRTASAAALMLALAAPQAAEAYAPRTNFVPASAAEVAPPQRKLTSIYNVKGTLIADAKLAKTRRPNLLRRTLSKLSNRKTLVGKFVRRLTHRPKVVTAAQAAKMIKAGDKVWMPIGHQIAGTVVDAMAARAKDPKGGLSAKKPVEIVALSNVAGRKLFDRSGKIQPKALFIGANNRDAISGGRGSFVPVFLSRIPKLLKEGTIKVDKAVIQVSPPDRFGYVTLGASAAATIAALGKAKTIIAEVNPNVPRTNGATKFHISKLDAIVKSNAPQVALPEPKIGATEKAIAKHIVKLIPKSPTLQFGIGGIPDAVAGQLAASGRKDLRVHSEMISDGVMKLAQSGAVKGKVKYSFAMGSQKMLKWLNKNRKAKAYTTDYINDPARVSKIKNVVSVNSALRVDLSGQVNAQYVKDAWYSGVGGQVDFFRGAMGSKGGKAILALPATTKLRNGKVISRIVPRLGEGDVVTTSMHDVQYVVTEHGVAKLDGKTSVERARALIKIAAPQFRQELTRNLDTQLASRKAAEQKRYDAYQARK
jgi:4-hydroxybutyrate CoA-transferase